MRKTMTMTLSILLAGVLLVLSTPADSEAAKKPSLSKTKMNLTQGKNKKLSVKNKNGYTITWKSNRKSVATVTKNGVIKAKKKGKAKISAIVRNKVTGKSRKLYCQVAVQGKASQGMAAPSSEAVSVTETDANTVTDTRTDAKTDTVTDEKTNIVSDAKSDTAVPMPEVIPYSTPVPDAVVTSAPKEEPHSVEPTPEFIDSHSVDIEGAKVLHSCEVNFDNLHVRTVLENQIIDSYEQLQTLIQGAKEEMARYSETEYEFTSIIRQLEAIDQEYFTTNVLCVDAIDFAARGYDFQVVGATVKETKQGDKALHILLNRYWALPDDICVTCDDVYYSCLIQMPRDAVEGCQSLACNLGSAVE